MFIKTDPRDSRPVYIQIAEQIVAQIDSGDIGDGVRLPSAVELAKSLDLNRNTVLQAYRHVRELGYLDLRRGRGAIACAPGSETDVLQSALNLVIRLAKDRGISLSSITNLLARGGLT